MTQEDRDQIVSQLRQNAQEQRDFLETNKDWSHPCSEPAAIAQMLTLDKLADIFETLRTE